MPKRYTQIYPAGKPRLQLNHQTKTYRRFPPVKPDTFANRVQSLGNFTGRADRELGIRTINGKKARGFNFNDETELDPSLPQGTVLDVWINVESNFPIRLEGKGKGYSSTVDIDWNLDFAASLFDTTPPEGYTEAKPSRAPQSIKERVR